jgi:predicted HicB family RNase H-like nuclease
VVVAEEPQSTEPVGFGEESSGRITLRLPESLKAGIEAAADREGISTNAWLVRTIARSLEQRQSKKSRNRMQGYAQG